MGRPRQRLERAIFTSVGWSGTVRAVSLEHVAVVVMAKYPEAGRVKTRLCPPLTPQQAADLHRVFLRHVLERLGRLGPAELVLSFDPPEAGTAMRRLAPQGLDMTCVPQLAGDLGARIAHAAGLVGEHHRRILFLGVDSPDVPEAHLLAAAGMTSQTAVSLGPTSDGGFWCLGLWNEVDAGALLEGIRWSSGREARQTIEHAEALGHAASLAPEWEDVDRPADLARLLRRLDESADPDDRRLRQALAGIQLPME